MQLDILDCVVCCGSLFLHFQHFGLSDHELNCESLLT